jgi:hypothetical protein
MDRNLFQASLDFGVKKKELHYNLFNPASQHKTHTSKDSTGALEEMY